MDDTSLSSIGLQLLFFSPLALAALGLLAALGRRWIVMGWTYQAKCDEAAAWKGLYEHSQTALAERTEALRVATSRADVASDTAQIATRLLTSLQAAGDARAPT